MGSGLILLGVLAAWAIRDLPGQRGLLGAYAVLAGFAWISLQIRQVFHPDHLGLTGLWRVLSFLGLGLGLIWLSLLHRRLMPQRLLGG